MNRDDRHAADVFELTYREFAALKPTHYRWSRLAPEAVSVLRRARAETWSAEKLAEYLHCPVDEAQGRLRRYVLSERVNDMPTSADKIFALFEEWLRPYESAPAARKQKARDVVRLLASQLQAAAESGETLDQVAAALEGVEPPSPPTSERPAWGPQWKD